VQAATDLPLSALFESKVEAIGEPGLDHKIVKSCSENELPLYIDRKKLHRL